MDGLIITDDELMHFNLGLKDNEESSIIYKHKGVFHIIDLNVCAQNYCNVNPQTNRCVAERNLTDYTFTFFTSGLLTKIVFKKVITADFFGKRLLSGAKAFRFNKLWELINRCGFTTCDLP